MKIISLMYPTVKLHGEAEQVLGSEIKGNGETKMFKELPKVLDDKSVINMPKPCGKECYFLVNIYVFNALKHERTDLIAFDEEHTTRNEQGQAISYGGLLFSDSVD